MDMEPEVLKGKPLSKEETKALIELIEQSKFINNKTTNATNNKLKTQEWERIAERFNATAAICRRTPQQLRLKWENLKKNARKRCTRIRMNSLQTGGGRGDYIPPDDILDRVSSLLGSTASGFDVAFGGDKAPILMPCNDRIGDVFALDSSSVGDGEGDGAIGGSASVNIEIIDVPMVPSVAVSSGLVLDTVAVTPISIDVPMEPSVAVSSGLVRDTVAVTPISTAAVERPKQLLFTKKSADPEKLLKSQGMAEAMEHVQEHLKIATPLNSTSQQEYEYIFFTYLDEDRNGMLDGLELVKSMIHHHDDDGKVILFSDEELASAVDSTLFVSDLNNDGWISYTEYRKRSESGQLKRVELKSGLILNY